MRRSVRAFVYWCGECRSKSPEPLASAGAAKREQQTHRDRTHGGLAPMQGDGVSPVAGRARGEGFSLSGVVVVALMVGVALWNWWH